MADCRVRTHAQTSYTEHTKCRVLSPLTQPNKPKTTCKQKFCRVVPVFRHHTIVRRNAPKYATSEYAEPRDSPRNRQCAFFFQALFEPQGKLTDVVGSLTTGCQTATSKHFGSAAQERPSSKSYKARSSLQVNEISRSIRPFASMKRSIDSSDDAPTSKVVLVERTTAPNGIPLVSPKRSGKKGRDDIIELAKSIGQADDFVIATTSSKLTLLSKQMQRLKEDAAEILSDARQDMRLNHAACNFQKVPGSIYYLYKRTSNQQYFSMVSPEEWGPAQPHEFVGAYRMEFDRSWTPAEYIAKEKLNIHQDLIEPQLMILDAI